MKNKTISPYRINLRRIINWMGLIIFFFLIFIWSYSEILSQGNDFGAYYSGSKFISKEYILYQDFFDHKGPFYYFFLQIIGKIIGWGILQATFSLFLSVSVFFCPLLITIIENNKRPLTITALLTISITLLFFQTSNASIAFFQIGLTITSLYFLTLKKENLLNYFFSVIFISLSIFTRIDSIVYLPLFLIYLLKLKSKLFLSRLILLASIPIIIFSLLSVYFGYSFNDYWINNITFNSWYSEYFKSSSFFDFKGFLFRPNTLFLGSITLIFPILIYILIEFLNKKILSSKSNLKSIIRFVFINKKNLINFSILFIALISFLITYSDKEYHSLIILCPSIFIISQFFEDIFKKNIQFYSILLILLLGINLSIIKKAALKNYNLIKVPKRFERIIQDIRQNQFDENDINFVGGNGWLYLALDLKPKRAINDWWLYSLPKPFETRYLIKQHEDILNKNAGYIFWINNILLNSEISSQNKYLKELKQFSSIVETGSEYTKFTIKKN